MRASAELPRKRVLASGGRACAQSLRAGPAELHRGVLAPTPLAARVPTSTQPCGYYQLKRFAATRNEALKLSFVEDATEYRLTDDAAVRLQRYAHSRVP